MKHESALAVESIDTFYGKSHILKDVSLSVRAGEVVGLLGRNGAGKTTTIRSIMGLTPPRKGRVTVFSEEVTRRTPHAVANLGVGYVPEGRRIFPNLTLEENLQLSLGKRSGSWTLDRVYELFPSLRKRRKNKGRQLSGGEQEMLAIGRALLLNPRLLVLDEPSQGLAPVVLQLLMKTLGRLRNEGVSMLLAEQNAHTGLEIADRVYVLDDGVVSFQGDAGELRKDRAQTERLTGIGGRVEAGEAI